MAAGLMLAGILKCLTRYSILRMGQLEITRMTLLPIVKKS